MTNLVFLNIGWMKYYMGLDGDSIRGGGSFVSKYKYGHEMFNFMPFEGMMYGFVEVRSTASIDITKNFGAQPGAPSISNILAIWVARNPDQGRTYIVGWYDNATVFRRRQIPTSGETRKINEYITPQIKARPEDVGKYANYFVTAHEDDCHLVPPSKRTFKIPRSKGGMGRPNIWYADKAKMADFRNEVINYIRGESQTVNLLRNKYGRGGEGTAHKSLKEWCAKNPQEIGLENVMQIPGVTERIFEQTGDRVDVAFEMPSDNYAVLEVETTDAEPGAHQILKYKTLLCAEKGLPIDSAQVKTMLVAWEIPQKVRAFCDRYGISWFEKKI